MLATAQTYLSGLLLLSLLAPGAWSCQLDGVSARRLASTDYGPIIADNIAARSNTNRQAAPGKLALLNVRIFDGSILQPPSTVIIDGDRIGSDHCDCPSCLPTDTYDAQGMTLLPGLIDSHAHPANVTHLTSLTSYGVTTTVNAFCLVPALCASLKSHTGLTSLVTASFIATTPNSTHALLVGSQNAGLLINSTADVPAFVARQVAEGADFIKVIGSAPGAGLSQDEQSALVVSSHEAGKLVVLHTSSYEAYREGLVAKVDQIHHSTLDVPVNDTLISMFQAGSTVICPTLTMMRAIIEQTAPLHLAFAPANETVALLHKAGIPILAGTDANLQPRTPGKVAFGSSLHDELDNLIDAGMTPVEALNAATTLPAKHFGLTDRGSIRVGMRADLLLVNGDPTANITVARNIAAVWVGGVMFKA